jgi:hypothetical protein
MYFPEISYLRLYIYSLQPVYFVCNPTIIKVTLHEEEYNFSFLKKKLSQPQRTFFDFDWSIINSTLSEERHTIADVFTEKLTHSLQNIGLGGFIQTVRRPYLRPLPFRLCLTSLGRDGL